MIQMRELARTDLKAFYSFVLPEAEFIWHDLSADIVAIGILEEGQPSGLVLAQRIHDGKVARLLSIVIRPDLQRRGVGKALLNFLGKKLQQSGCGSVHVEFLAPEEGMAGEAAFLLACGFAAPHQGVYIRRGRLRSVERAEWMKLKLPSSFSLDTWGSLTKHDRALIEAEAGKEYPDILSPFPGEEGIDPMRSMLLRYQGKPAGWLILEEWDSSTILLKTMYVYRKHQRLARGIALGAEVMRRLMEERHYEYAALCVEQENIPMVQFMLRHISGDQLIKQVLWRTFKTLDAK